MKKLLTSVGLVLSLLISTMFPRTQAQDHVSVPARIPTNAYKISSHAGTFVDISSKTGVVTLGADIADGTDLKNYFFEPTSESDMTPVNKQITANASTTSTKSEFCFPLGFTFKISGKPMQYFLVNALGGAYFSPEPTRTPANCEPTGYFTADCIHTAIYAPASATATSPTKFPANKLTKALGKAPACYLIEGSAGSRVLTIQHDFLVNGDEWIFQTKYYEGSNNFEMVVGELKADNINTPTKPAANYYSIYFGLFESMPNTYGKGELKVEDTLSSSYLYVPSIPMSGTRKWYAGRNSRLDPDSGWSAPEPVTSLTAVKGLVVSSLQQPATGSTVRFTSPAPCGSLPAFKESDYTVAKPTNTDTELKVQIGYQTDLANEFGLYNLSDLGSIVAISSASDEPDFTLENGTFYFTGYEFPESNGFTPTVLVNKFPTFSSQGNPLTTQYSLKSITPLTLPALSGMDKNTCRYIHIYRMSVNCDGAPIYSPLCFTIRREPTLEPPAILETVGLPTVSSVKLHAKPADGMSVIVIKSKNNINISPKGQLKKGSKIGEAEVVALLDKETTWDQTLTPGEGCYFVAITVNTSNANKYVYSPDNRIWCPARTAYNGLPGLIDMSKETCAIPNKELEGYNIKSVGWQSLEGATYRDLPLGWTRTLPLADGKKHGALGLGNPGYANNVPVALYSTALVGSAVNTDAITVPILANKNRIALTYDVQFWSADASGGCSNTTPQDGDQLEIQYAIGDGAWQSAASWTGSTLPSIENNVYKLTYTLIDDNLTGQYIRFRFVLNTVSRSDWANWVSIKSVEIKEDKLCSTPTNVRQNKSQTTTTQIPLSWSDPNLVEAPTYLVAYKRAEAAGDWAEKTVNAKNATLTGLRSSTTYLVRITAVCGEDNDSYPTDTIYMTSAYTFPYTESMAQRDSVVKVQGSNVTAVLYNPFPGKSSPSYIQRRDGGVTTYTGQLPGSGTASLTQSDGYTIGAFSSNFTYYKVNNIATADPHGVQRLQLKAVGVNERAQYAWLMTPVIYTADLTENEPLTVRFKATSASRNGTATPFTKGSVGSKYSAATLKVLVSNTGDFSNSNVIGTVYVGTTTIDSTSYEFDLPTPLTGSVQVAFYYANSSYVNDNAIENNEDYMTFEIFDVRFEYKNDVAICPALEGLERTFLTPHSATFEWAKSDSAKYYDFAYGPADEDGYTETVKVTDPQYTITDLDEQTSYKVMVTGYCDEDGENAAPDPLTAEFTTPEGCHTPTSFKVQDVTYYGATFISKQTQSILTEREVYAVSSDNAHKKVFKQLLDTLVQESGLHDNTSYTAQTRSICRYGTGSVDTSDWSNAVSFTTPVDPANLPDTFNILLVVQPAGAGSATGAGQYVEDATITIKATPNEGYVFVEWQDAEGNTVSKNATHTMTAKQDDEIIIDPTIKTHTLSYTAVFRKIFTITVNTDPAGTTGGTVTGAGTYNEGTEVTLTATPKSAYLFVEWQNAEGTSVSTNATYKFTPTASGTYTAIFRLKEYFTLDVAVTPNDDWGAVSASPQPNEDDQYLEGREVTLTATPAQYCKFVEWQDNNGTTVSTNATLKVTMDGNKTFKAVFAQIRYTVTLKSDPSTTYGTIKGTSGSTSTGGTFVAGTTRRIVAQPKSGYAFVKWMSGTKQLGTDTVLTFVLTQDTTITAYFKEKDSLEVKVTVSPANAGTVTGAGKVKRGSQAKLTATPAAHYAFKEWRRLDNSTITTNPYTFTPDRDYTFTAVFRDLAQYTITVQNDGGGTVTDAGGNTVTGVQTYEEGSKVTLTATADEGYTFTEWQDQDGETLSTDATYEFTATGSATVKAVFTENTKYTVTLQRVPSSAAGTTTGAGKYEANTEVTITATPAKGYRFVAWQKADGTEVSDQSSYTFTLTANVTYKAVFEALVEIKVTVDPEGAGTVTGAGTYEQGDEVTLSATADDDYLFVAWKADGKEFTDNPYTFTADKSQNFTASFREKGYFSIDVPCLGGAEDEDDLGTVSIPGDDEGEWKEGETVTMTATPNPYCKFVKWMDKNGNTLSTNPAYTFVISQDTMFQAVFAHIQYTVTLKSDPNTTYGTINGTTGSTSTGGTFNAGTTRHLEAKPKSGYAFVKWMSGSTELGTNPVFEFVLTKDTTITAYFKEKEELTITVNVEPANAGTVTGNGNVQRGNDAVLTATANAGYKFLYWERVDGTQHEDNPYTLVQPKRDYTFKAVFRAKAQYTITVNNLPNAAAGTVTKTGLLANGKAEEDATITLTATPAEGYAFVEWQNAAGDPVGTNATLSFQATANATYNAVFEELPTPEYTVTVNMVPANGGRIVNDGSYPEGSVVTLKARPNRNYAFDGWYDAAGTTKLSADTAYTVTLTADVTYTAKFKEKETVDVTVDVLPEVNAGSITGAGNYDKNKTVTLTATAAEGYTFYRWVDVDNDNDPVSTSNPYTFTATQDVHYAAEFRGQYEVALNILPDENAGEVKGAGFYRLGSKVTLEATAYTGYVFVEWQDASGSTVSENRTHEITVTGNMTYTAKFVTVDEEHRHTITVRRLPNNEAGTVSGNGRYLHGDQDTLRATPAENYLFVAWLKQNADDASKYDTVSKKNPYVFTVEGDSSYTALFRLRARYTIDVDILPNDNAGTATGDGEYREGRAVTLEATPNAGYVFVAWVLKTDTPSAKDTVSRTASYTFVASRNATYKAVFRKTAAKYTLTLNVTPANAGTVTGEGTFSANETVTITAKPNAGYQFSGWRASGTIVSTDPSFTFQITKDITYTAVFKKKEVMTVTLNVTPENAGTVTGAGEYPVNAEAMIAATAAKGYRFVAWQAENGETVSTDAAYAFTVTTDVTYTAVFEERELETYTVKTGILPSGSAAGTATGDGQYKEGTMVTVTATPNAGYIFKAWVDDNNETLSTEAVYTFEVLRDITCWALFESETGTTETVIIALKALPSNAAGTLKGAGKYEKGKLVTITAEAAANYTFVAWLNANGDTVSKQPTHTFKAETDASFSALFKEKATANEQLLKAAFNVGAGNGHLYIDNLNAVTVREVAVFNTVGRQLAHFTPNSNANLALPVDARYAILVVRVISEQGVATYKVYLH